MIATLRRESDRVKPIFPRVPEPRSDYLVNKVRGEVMKPNPHEKCIVIKTKGKKIRSNQEEPINSDEISSREM